MCLYEWNNSAPNGVKKKKVKRAIVQALRLCTGRTVHRGRRGITPLFHDHGTRGEGSASRPGRSLSPGKTRYTLYRGWVGPRAGLDRCGKSRPQPGFDPRTVQPVVSSYTDYATRHTQTERHSLNLYLSIFRKSAQIIQVSFETDKNNGYFT